MQIIDELIEGYKTIYGKALEGWDRSLADKEIRTVVDSGMDDANKKRSVRTETRPGNPACLGQARGALDSIGKLLGLAAPAQVKIEEEEDEAPVKLEDLTEDDYATMPTRSYEQSLPVAGPSWNSRTRRRRPCLRSPSSPGRTTG